MLSDIRVLAGAVLGVFAISIVFAIAGTVNPSLIPGASKAEPGVIVQVTRTAFPATEPAETPEGTPPADETPTAGQTPTGEVTRLELIGENILFEPTELEAPAGRIVIEFDNRDAGIPHNVAVHEGTDATGELMGDTEIEPGPVVQELELDLEAGTYFYICVVHPTTMTGILTVN